MSTERYIPKAKGCRLVANLWRKGSVTVALFHEDGHLTDETLEALHDGTLNEKERLAVSEHISQCDDCLSRYTDALCGQNLLVPAAPVAPNVMKRLRGGGGKRSRGLALALCCIVGLWLLVTLVWPVCKRAPHPPEAPRNPGYSVPLNEECRSAEEFFLAV